MPRRIDKIREAGNDELRVQERELTEQIFRLHHPGHVDEHVERRIIFRHFLGERLDMFRIGDIERDRFHPGIGSSGFVERLLTAAGDDDLIPKFVKSFR